MSGKAHEGVMFSVGRYDKTTGHFYDDTNFNSIGIERLVKNKAPSTI